MRRFVQVVLALNIAIVAVVDAIGLVFHVGPNARIFAAEPIMGRQYVSVAIAYAIVLALIVWPRFQREPVWLLVPTTFLSVLWLDAIYELAAATGPVSEDLPPAIIRILFVASYLTGYAVLRRRTGKHVAATADATGRSGAAATN
jgi:hypothetical protein